MTAAATTAESVLNALKWRYATKKFDPSRKIPEGTWRALEEAMVLAPSSYGLQPWRFVVVDDAATRARLRPASWHQPQITDAAKLVVLAARTTLTEADADKFIKRVSEVRGAPAEALAGYRGMIVGSIKGAPSPEFLHAWSARQCYIALGFVLQTAALLGVDACPMEGIETPKYDEILGLQAEGFGAVVAVTLGYRAADDASATAAKVRYPAADVVRRV